ncbi:MAG TPA: GNAT family N-acetyltransferase [Nitriliruptoraceae bacterium]|nr:GNAT family N-acetyltransferase [Nitriliruptoraceae bacterium]
MTTRVRQARLDTDLDDVAELWGEYLRWANDQLDAEFGFRMDIEAALAANLADPSPFEPPDGRLLLAFDDTGAVGIACLQRLRPDTAEVKRMFVRPAARGCGVGKSLLDELVTAARSIGYDRVLLDSARFMDTAHAMYRSAGFTDIDPYPESAIPSELRHYWRFMELPLP